MVEIGKYNKLEVLREASFGFFLNGGTENTSDDILLPKASTLNNEIKIGDFVDVFIYRDSKDRIVATMKKPLAIANSLSYLQIVDVAEIGGFASIGLERDVLIPKKEQKYDLEKYKSYLLYVYVDKTGRLAASTNIDKHLKDDHNYKVNDEVIGTCYGFQTNGSAFIAVDDIYRGVILKNEYFGKIEPGEKLKLRVIKLYEDNKLGLTPRKKAKDEISELENKILNYLKKHNGKMEFNDKSDPLEIKETFSCSKNQFKNALGGLMKKNLIKQNKDFTELV